MTDDTTTTDTPWSNMHPDERREIELCEMNTLAKKMRDRGKSLAEINASIQLHVELVEEIESDYRVQRIVLQLLESGLSNDDIQLILALHQAHLERPETQKYGHSRDVQQRQSRIELVT